MPHYRTFFIVIVIWIVAAAGIVPAWGQSPWNAEQKAVIQSFVTQYKAIRHDDIARFKKVVLPIIHIGGKPVRLKPVFIIMKKKDKKDPADSREAYNPDRIVGIKITGDVAKMDLRDTKTNEMQHFTFQRIGGIWMWAALN